MRKGDKKNRERVRVCKKNRIETTKRIRKCEFWNGSIFIMSSIFTAHFLKHGTESMEE